VAEGIILGVIGYADRGSDESLNREEASSLTNIAVELIPPHPNMGLN
jgi:hypothetical protein